MPESETTASVATLCDAIVVTAVLAARASLETSAKTIPLTLRSTNSQREDAHAAHVASVVAMLVARKCAAQVDLHASVVNAGGGQPVVSGRSANSGFWHQSPNAKNIVVQASCVPLLQSVVARC